MDALGKPTDRAPLSTGPGTAMIAGTELSARIQYGLRDELRLRAGARAGALRIALIVSLAGCLIIAPTACSSAAPDPAAPGDSADALAAMRYRVAVEPTDLAARVALARLEHRAGRPGAALAQLTEAARGGRLARAERSLLATLYARRFEERRAAGDGDAYQDAEAALALDEEASAPGLTPAARADGYFLAALAALRRGGPWGRREAAGFLARAAALAPGDGRAAALLATREAAPAGAPAAAAGQRGGQGVGQHADQDFGLAQLERAGLWLHRGGARRAARALLERYLHQGGRGHAALQALIAERAWWGGADTRPGLLLSRTLHEAGVSLCPLARTPADLGCDASLPAIAEAGGALAGVVWQRAAQRFWRTADAHQAEAWALLALRAWLAGEGSWLALVRRRVDVARLLPPARPGQPKQKDRPGQAGQGAAGPGQAGQGAAGPGQAGQGAAAPDSGQRAGVPAYVAPVLWRAAGQPERAAEALDRVLAQVLAPASPSPVPSSPSVSRPAADTGPSATMPAEPSAWSAGAQALIVAEAAVQERAPEVLDALRVRLPGAGVLGWAVAVRHARALGDETRVRALLAEQPAHARDYLRLSGELGPLAWEQVQAEPRAGAQPELRPGGQAAPQAEPQTGPQAAQQVRGASAPAEDHAHALAWWWQLLSRHPGLRAGRDARWQAWQRTGGPVPPGWRLPADVPVALPTAVLVRDPTGAVAQERLVAITRAYERDPALADRLARELVQEAASVGRHGPAVAALFTALGDPARALAWWQQVVAESPGHPPYLLALGVAAAAAGDVARARVHFNAAAARSGDAGATSLAAARHLLRQGLALAAIGEARNALALTAPGERGPVLAVLATAMTSLGRAQDARAMRQAWRAELSSGGAPAPTTSPPTTSPEDMDADIEADTEDPALRRAIREEDPARARRALAAALAWNPGQVSLHRQLLARLEPGSAAHAEAVAALLGVALTAPRARARGAFQVLAAELARLGAAREAELAQRAYRLLDTALAAW